MLKNTAIDSSKSIMSPMSDKQVEEYIHIFFEHSPKANYGTAPAEEWFMFLKRFNQQQHYFILTEEQRKSIEPYCLQNPDLEMTPEEFIMLVSMIRHEEPKLQTSSSATRRMFDSSNLALAKNTYYGDRDSVNHPDDRLNHTSGQTRESDFNDENNKAHFLIEKLTKERKVAARQLQEYEARIIDLQDECSRSISQLQARLEKMQIDADQQKRLLTDQKNKETDRLKRIAELKSQNEEYEKKHALDLKRLQNKTEELDILGEELRNLQEIHNIAEKEKANCHMKLEQEKRQTLDARHEVEAQQNENAKLIELIDKQKSDLDGLRYYTTTPTVVSKKNGMKDDSEQNLANEQIEAEYAKRLVLVKQERDDYEQQLILTRDKLEQVQTAAALIQVSQAEKIQALSNGFDQQLSLVESIKQRIGSNQHSRGSKLYLGLSIIPWVFLFYHLLLVLFYYLLEVTQMDPAQTYPFSFLKFIDELFFKYLQRTS